MTVKRNIAAFLVFTLLISFMPLTAFAADNEEVLTGITHTVAGNGVISGKNITFTVNYNFTGNIYPADGLDISYNTTQYQTAIARFDLSVVDSGVSVGDTVPMTLEYKKTGDETLYNTVYSVTVARAAYVKPEFSGTISKSAVLPAAISFSLSDFSAKYQKNDGGSLGSVVISGSNPSFGSLKLGSADYSLGDKINAADLSSLKFEAADTGSVDYIVTAYASGDDATVVGTAVLSLSVDRSTSAGTVSLSTNSITPVALSASGFATAFSNANGATLSYIKFPSLPSSSTGVLYLNYVSSSNTGTAVLADTSYFNGTSPSISNITFVPSSGYSGTASISYTAYDTNGHSYSGTLNITVAAAAVSDITYSVDNDNVKTFSGTDFNNVCKNYTGKDLSYVKFELPSSSSGILYYDYTSSSDYGSKVSSTTKYYVSSSPYLKYVSFVPKTDYSGTVTISYTGCNINGNSFTGKVKITVSDSGSSDTITYSVDENEEAEFDIDDFNDVCDDETDENFSYVKFTLPSSSYGTLYYDYTSSSDYGSKVSASTKYYRSSSPYLKYVSFVPKTDYSGTVTISYTGCSTGGDSYSGKIKITVGDSGDNIIKYSVDENEEAEFDVDDFNDVCDDETDETLSYVKFTLPSSSYGTLYYNYTSSSDYGSKVSASTKYYRSSSPYLKYVSFVPKTDYSGTVTISYTGYSTGGDSYSGKIRITVGDSGDDSLIKYEVDKNKEAEFDIDDFNNVCDDETDENLSYVKFTLPSSSYGTLYYNYTSSSDYGSKVSASTKYYRSSSPYLKYVSFVPKTDYSGTVTISYTGYSTGGDSYSGKVKITVGSGTETAAAISYSTKNKTPATFSSSDFNRVCDNATGDSLSYVKFTLPSSSYGKLYYNYTSSSSYTSEVSSGTKYYYSSSPYLSKVTFVPNSSYKGTVTINYTGYSSDNESYSGKVNITVTASGKTSQYFLDVDENYSWAVDAIDALYIKSIVSGTATGKYSPSVNIKRGDFMLMLYKALNLSSNGTVKNFSDVSKDSYYYTAVLTAKSLGIAKGDNGCFYPEKEITRQDAIVLVTRALKLSGKSLTAGSKNDVSSFTDNQNVSDYAFEAVCTLVKAKVISGNNSRINPKSPVTRAEMAVILYRAISL